MKWGASCLHKESKMALVINGSPELQVAEIGGRFIDFKPGEIKRLTENEAFFLESKKSYQGFKTLPQKFEDDYDYRGTPEGKKIIEERKAEGLKAYVGRLRQMVFNVEESMAKDLKGKNVATSPWSFASDEEMQALEKLAKLNAKEEDEQQAKADKAKKLVASLNLTSEK